MGLQVGLARLLHARRAHCAGALQRELAPEQVGYALNFRAAAIARVFVRRRGNGRRFPIHGQRRELIAYDGRVSLYHLSIVFALPQTKSSRKPARAQNTYEGWQPTEDVQETALQIGLIN